MTHITYDDRVPEYHFGDACNKIEQECVSNTLMSALPSLFYLIFIITTIIPILHSKNLRLRKNK